MTVEAVSQRDYARRKEHAAVTTSLHAWPQARADAQAVGYPRSVGFDPGGGSRTVLVTDPDTGLEVAVPVTVVEGTAFSLIERPDPGTRWIQLLFQVLSLFLDPQRPSPAGWWIEYTEEPADALKDEHCVMCDPTLPPMPPETDIYYCPHHVVIAHYWHDAVDDHVNRWPAQQHQAKLLSELASKAKFHWPPPPDKGDTIDGVTVGARTNTADIPCANCGLPVDKVHDPGKQLGRQELLHKSAGPGHGNCYDVVWRSRRRVA